MAFSNAPATWPGWGWPVTAGGHMPSCDRGECRVDTAMIFRAPRWIAGEERRGQSHAAIAVPGAVDLDGGKDEGQRARGEHMIHSQAAVDPLFARAVADEGPEAVRRLQPRHRLSGHVARGGQRNRADDTGLKVARDALEHALGVGPERVGQELPQRLGVGKAAPASRFARAASDEAAAPAREPRRQIDRIDATHVVRPEVLPDFGQPGDRLAEPPVPRCEVHRDHAAGGDTREDPGHHVGMAGRKMAQDAHLVGRASAAARQHERKVRVARLARAQGGWRQELFLACINVERRRVEQR